MKTFTLMILSLSVFALSPMHAADPVKITVHKTKTCGCCAQWEKHLRDQGFEVTSIASDESAPVDKVRDEKGVPQDRRACHTAIVDGYFVEGHVPAEAIKRVLKEKPKNVKGIAVPGMPIGSPGMEMGSRVDPYVVYQIDNKGKSSVFENYPKK